MAFRRLLFFIAAMSSPIAAHALERDAPCTVASTSVSLRDITVEIAGAKPLHVSVESAAIVAHPGKVRALVDVDHELAFSGTTPNADLPYRLRPRARSSNGIVTLGARSWDARDVSSSENEVRLSAGREPSFVLGLTAWPCDALTLGETSVLGRRLTPPGDRDAERVDLFLYTHYLRGRVVIYAAPDRKQSITFTLKNGSSQVRAKVLGRQRSLVEISAALDEYGATATGWVDAASIARTAPQRDLGNLGSIGKGGGGGCGFGGGGPGYIGPIAVVGAARIYTATDRRVAWATAHQRDTWEAYYVPGQEYVEILEVPGLQIDSMIACKGAMSVKRSDVVFGVSRKNGLTLERRWSEGDPIPDEATPSGPIVVTALVPQSRWAQLGLQVGDRLIAFAGRKFLASDSLSVLRRTIGCGGHVLLIERGQDAAELEVALPNTCPSRGEFFGNGAYDVHW